MRIALEGSQVAAFEDVAKKYNKFLTDHNIIDFRKDSKRHDDTLNIIFMSYAITEFYKKRITLEQAIKRLNTLDILVVIDVDDAHSKYLKQQAAIHRFIKENRCSIGCDVVYVKA